MLQLEVKLAVVIILEIDDSPGECSVIAVCLYWELLLVIVKAIKLDEPGRTQSEGA